MNIEEILVKVDKLFEENKGQEAEKVLLASAAEAVEKQEDGCLLQLLNELIGYYRVVGRFEEAYSLAQRAIDQAKDMGLENTIPYATTLLNAANAYRAGGRLQDSLKLFHKVQSVYEKNQISENMLAAGLNNNMSLLYMELGDFEAAYQCLLKALEIVKKKGADYEVAVTYANLASVCVNRKTLKEAKKYAEESIRVFERISAKDSHYGAALAALGACAFDQKNYAKALEYFQEAMELVEQGIGKNQDYLRLEENKKACEEKLKEKEGDTDAIHENNAGIQSRGVGLVLSKEYFDTYGMPMLNKRFPSYINQIAAGLAGRGSDCFGYDDEASRDHDWGPDFCLWVTEEVYEEIGNQLQQAYDDLPDEFKGYKRAPHVNGKNRRGVMTISQFYESLLGTSRYEEIDWTSVSDSSLAAAVNGQVFTDPLGEFSKVRKSIKKGYPERILYLKIAEAASRFAQTALYNFPRMYERGDLLTAQMLVWDGVKEALRLQHYIERRYPVHDKWLMTSMEETEAGRTVIDYLHQVNELLKTFETSAGFIQLREKLEELGDFFARELYGLDIISDIDYYLDAHSEELIYKASLVEKPIEELVEKIAEMEFEAFDKVKNEGGRASCQNDWMTFSIMRKSQYLTWNKTMLLQYLYDFHREINLGHNLIEEKYGRMMESTAPEKYQEFKNQFPELSEEKKSIIEQICRMQVGWMEEFAGKYPALADNARSIHTAEDNPFNTSYETYLRGELGTYSDKMLELYGRYIVDYAKEGKNLAFDIMENNVHMYGYQAIEEAEQKTKAAWY